MLYSGDASQHFINVPKNPFAWCAVLTYFLRIHKSHAIKAKLTFEQFYNSYNIYSKDVWSKKMNNFSFKLYSQGARKGRNARTYEGYLEQKHVKNEWD